MTSTKTTVAAVRKAFYQSAIDVGFSAGDGFVSKEVNDNYSVVAVFYPLSRNGRVLAGCEVGLCSAWHQKIAVEVTQHLEGIKARPEWKRFWFPFFTAGWVVTLTPDARSSQDIRGFSFHGRQACWYHSDNLGAASVELRELARFLSEESFTELSKFASDEEFQGLLSRRNLAIGPNDVLEAILLYLRGDPEGGRRILQCEIPKKNLFVREAYPGILARLEDLLESGRFAGLVADGHSGRKKH